MAISNGDGCRNWAIMVNHEAAQELVAMTVMVGDDLARMIGEESAAMVVNAINAQLDAEELGRGRV